MKRKDIVFTSLCLLCAALLFPIAYYSLGRVAPDRLSNYFLVLFFGIFLFPLGCGLVMSLICRTSRAFALFVSLVVFVVMLLQNFVFPNTLAFAYGLKWRIGNLPEDALGKLVELLYIQSPDDRNESTLSASFKSFGSTGKSIPFSISKNPAILNPEGGYQISWWNGLFSYGIFATRERLEADPRSFVVLPVQEDVYIYCYFDEK